MAEYKPIETLIAHTKEYVQTRVDEAKLAAAEKTTSIIALLAAGATIVLLFGCCLLFAGVAASIGLGLWLGKTWLGFLLVASVWFLLGCIAWTAKDRIIRIPVMNVNYIALLNNDCRRSCSVRSKCRSKALQTCRKNGRPSSVRPTPLSSSATSPSADSSRSLGNVHSSSTGDQALSKAV
jgi:hypothetical protein